MYRPKAGLISGYDLTPVWAARRSPWFQLPLLHDPHPSHQSALRALVDTQFGLVLLASSVGMAEE